MRLVDYARRVLLVSPVPRLNPVSSLPQGINFV
jgi:hypothetical protein